MLLKGSNRVLEPANIESESSTSSVRVVEILGVKDLSNYSNTPINIISLNNGTNADTTLQINDLDACPIKFMKSDGTLVSPDYDNWVYENQLYTVTYYSTESCFICVPPNKQVAESVSYYEHKSETHIYNITQSLGDTETESEESFDIPVVYNESNTILNVYVNGFKLNSSEYTIDTTNNKVKITLTKPSNGTVEIDALRFISATLEDYSALRGEGVPTGGTTGQVLLKNSDTDLDTKWGNAVEYSTDVVTIPSSSNTVTVTITCRKYGHVVYLSGTASLPAGTSELIMSNGQYFIPEKYRPANKVTLTTAEYAETIFLHVNPNGTMLGAINTSVDTAVEAHIWVSYIVD